jgi:hypothetical protein
VLVAWALWSTGALRSDSRRMSKQVVRD